MDEFWFGNTRNDMVPSTPTKLVILAFSPLRIFAVPSVFPNNALSLALAAVVIPFSPRFQAIPSPMLAATAAADVPNLTRRAGHGVSSI